MDHLDNMFTDLQHDEKIDFAIRKASAVSKRVLNRYYQLSDLSMNCRAAVGQCRMCNTLYCEMLTLTDSPPPSP